MSLVVAIFLIVVIASLAAFAVTAGNATRGAVNLQLLSARALAAARAGAEWGGYRALSQASCVTTGTNLTISLGALRGFRVTVTCLARTQHTDAGTYFVADIQSVAQWGTFGQADYAYRSVTQRYSSAP